MVRSIVSVAAALAMALPASTRAEESGFGFSLHAELGAGETARDLDTEVGWVYGAILGVHFAGPLALELEYQHAENDLTDVGGVTFKQNSLLGHVRLDLTRGPVTPFVYAGVGWTHFYGDSAGVSGGEDRVVVPAGVGIEFLVKPLVLGARGEYQWNTDSFAGQYVDYWKVVGTIGIRIP